MPKGPYKDIKCGSYSGYQRHYRLKELACDACKAGAREYVRNYYNNNKEKILARLNLPLYKAKKKRRKARRKARLRGAKTEVYTVERVLELYGTDCHICREPIDLKAPRGNVGENWQNGLHIDHVIAIANSGDDTLINVRPSHALCNLRKSTK